MYQPVRPYTDNNKNNDNNDSGKNNNKNMNNDNQKKNSISKYSNVRLSFVDLVWAQLYVSLVSFVVDKNDEKRLPELEKIFTCF